MGHQRLGSFTPGMRAVRAPGINNTQMSNTEVLQYSDPVDAGLAQFASEMGLDPDAVIAAANQAAQATDMDKAKFLQQLRRIPAGSVKEAATEYRKDPGFARQLYQKLMGK